jgi:uncharacterized membrane protein
MSDLINGKPPTSFWIIGIVALMWNIIGVMLYYIQVSASPEELQAAYGEVGANFIESIPTWATSAHAIAVTAGVLGCVLLLVRKAWAVPLFIISLAGIVVQDIYSFVMAGGASIFGTPAIVIAVVVLLVAIGLVFYSRSAKDRHWID